MFRSSHRKCTIKNKIFSKSQGKHLCWSLFLGLQLYQKETPTQVFSYYYCQIFKTYFEEHLQTAASAPILAVLVILLFVAEKQCFLTLAKRTTISIIATNKQARHNFVFAKRFSYAITTFNITERRPLNTQMINAIMCLK